MLHQGQTIYYFADKISLSIAACGLKYYPQHSYLLDYGLSLAYSANPLVVVRYPASDTPQDVPC